MLRTWICPIMWTRIKHETLGIGHGKWDMVAVLPMHGSSMWYFWNCRCSKAPKSQWFALGICFSEECRCEKCYFLLEKSQCQNIILLAERLTSSKLTMPKRRRTAPVHPWCSMVLRLQSSSYPTLNLTLTRRGHHDLR